MALSFGFFNSLDGDRKYNAEQMSAIFDGIITDGVFDSIGDLFATVPGNGLEVIVKPGKAWFDHTWTFNDTSMPLAIQPADVTLSRYDAVVLEVNAEESVRANSIMIVTGTPASNPIKPGLINTEKVHQHPLSYILVGPGATELTSSAIEIVVGKSECPFITSVLESVSIEALFAQWQGDFDTWFTDVQSQLEGDVATNLLNRINQLNTKVDENYEKTLSAETKELYGLSEDATPDAAFVAAGPVFFDGYYTENPPYKTDRITLLGTARSLAAASSDTHALFGGGVVESSTYSSIVTAFTENLTRLSATSLSVARFSLAAVRAGTNILFGGGAASGSNYYNVVDAYSSTLTRTTPAALSVARNYLAATSVGNYALFGGGINYSSSSNVGVNSVDAYNVSLTRTTPTALSVARGVLASTSVGNYALFGGGSSNNSYSRVSNVVDAYNASLTRTTPTALSVARYDLAAVTAGGYALFGGGANSSSGDSTVDAYNASLARIAVVALGDGRFSSAGASIGKYALFGGGGESIYSTSDAVDVYVGDTGYTLPIPGISAYKFDGLHATEQITTTGMTLTGIGKLTGYIRRTGFTITGKH